MQVLCIRGFLAARKHADRILLLVEMLGGSGFPCFKAGPRTMQALRRRFALQATEPQVRRIYLFIHHFGTWVRFASMAPTLCRLVLCGAAVDVADQRRMPEPEIHACRACCHCRRHARTHLVAISATTF